MIAYSHDNGELTGFEVVMHVFGRTFYSCLQTEAQHFRVLLGGLGGQNHHVV